MGILLEQEENLIMMEININIIYIVNKFNIFLAQVGITQCFLLCLYSYSYLTK